MNGDYEQDAIDRRAIETEGYVPGTICDQCGQPYQVGLDHTVCGLTRQLAAEVAKVEEAAAFLADAELDSFGEIADHYEELRSAVRAHAKRADKAEAERDQLRGELERTKNPKAGTCCACGYGSTDEGPCPSRDDGQHCEHWWDGPDALAAEPEPKKD